MRYTHLKWRRLGIIDATTTMNPRIGATLDIQLGVALFAGYATGFRGSFNFSGLKAETRNLGKHGRGINLPGPRRAKGLSAPGAKRALGSRDPAHMGPVCAGLRQTLPGELTRSLSIRQLLHRREGYRQRYRSAGRRQTGGCASSGRAVHYPLTGSP